MVLGPASLEPARATECSTAQDSQVAFERYGGTALPVFPDGDHPIVRLRLSDGRVIDVAVDRWGCRVAGRSTERERPAAQAVEVAFALPGPRVPLLENDTHDRDRIVPVLHDLGYAVDWRARRTTDRQGRFMPSPVEEGLMS